MTDIVLASASPRRRELMKLITADFISAPADVDETVPDGMDPLTYAVYVSEKKADAAIKKRGKDGIYIGCDTSVVIDGMILGKPKDADDAFAMLKKLSGRSHLVITGVCIAEAVSNKKKIFEEVSKVFFYDLSDDEIYSYVKTGEPMDKAGAYGIQERGGLFVRRIEGDFFNIIGLPVARLARELRSFI